MSLLPRGWQVHSPWPRRHTDYLGPMACADEGIYLRGYGNGPQRVAYKTPEQGLANPKATWAPWLAPKRGFIFTVGTAGQARGDDGDQYPRAPRTRATAGGGLNSGKAPKVETLAYKRTRLAVYLRCVA